MDNEISFENSRAFREFEDKVNLQNWELLRVMESARLIKSALLNAKLNTEVYHPPTWYWRDYVDDQVKEGGEK